MIKLDALTIAVLNNKPFVYSDHKHETHLKSGHLFNTDWSIFRDATASKAKHYQVMMGDNLTFYV